MAAGDISELYQKLYFEDKKFSEIVPEEIIDWVKQIILENYNKTINPEIRYKMMIKVNHTKKVVEAGWEIRKNSKNLDLLLVSLVCFLHDIGRFPQVLNNTFSDVKSKIDHGMLAYEMIKNKKMNVSDADKDKIAEAILWHNKKNYTGSNPYAFLIRDADKIALFREFEKLEENANNEGFKGSFISNEVLNEFKLKKNLSKEIIKTKNEWLLYTYSWLWDLNLESSKKIALKENFADIIEERLKEKVGTW